QHRPFMGWAVSFAGIQPVSHDAIHGRTVLISAIDRVAAGVWFCVAQTPASIAQPGSRHRGHRGLGVAGLATVVYLEGSYESVRAKQPRGSKDDTGRAERGIRDLPFAADPGVVSRR